MHWPIIITIRMHWPIIFFYENVLVYDFDSKTIDRPSTFESGLILQIAMKIIHQRIDFFIHLFCNRLKTFDFIAFKLKSNIIFFQDAFNFKITYNI